MPDGALVVETITEMQIRNITCPDHVYPCRSEHSFNQVAGMEVLALRDPGFATKGRGLNPAIPSAFMIFATVSYVIRTSSARESAVILGAP